MTPAATALSLDALPSPASVVGAGWVMFVLVWLTVVVSVVVTARLVVITALDARQGCVSERAQDEADRAVAVLVLAGLACVAALIIDLAVPATLPNGALVGWTGLVQSGAVHGLSLSWCSLAVLALALAVSRAFARRAGGRPGDVAATRGGLTRR